MKKIQFKKFIKLQRGFDLPEQNRNIGKYPIIASTSIVGYHNEYKVQAPLVVTGRSGTLGEVQYVNANSWPLNTTLWVKDYMENDPRYVYYFLKNLNLKQFNSGTGVPTLNRNDLNTLNIRIHDIKIQKKISGILENYDNFIANNIKIIRNLEEIIQKIYREWFINFKFPNCEKAKFKQNKIAIPLEWEEKSLLNNNIFLLANNKVKPFEGIKIYFATADVVGTDIISSGEKITYEKKPSRAQIQPQLNTIWFARMSNTYKVLAFNNTNEDLMNSLILSSGFVGFQTNADTFGFVYAYVNSPEFNKLKDLYATGATQVSLTNEGLSKIKILIPKYELIKKYSLLIENMINQSNLLKEKNRKLKQTRDILLSKLISGKIDISTMEVSS